MIGLLGKALVVGACGLVAALSGGTARGGAAEPPFKLYPIGTVERKGNEVRLRILDQYRPALKGLDGFSHVWVFYWFDRNDTPAKRRILQVHPRGNRKNPLTGVFACRAPVRPNLIALTLCKILSVKGGIVRVARIDAFDNTPILDLKPFIPRIDVASKGARLPDWLQ